jgi:hypothetical protein
MMRKSFVVLGFVTLALMFISGCSSFSGITQTETPGSYYVTVNKQIFFGNSPRIMHCTSAPTDHLYLDCKHVTWKATR